MYRSSTGTLDHYDDAPRGGERWDRDRFERMARRAPPPRDVKDDFHFHEHDRFSGGRRDINIRDDYERRAPPPPTRVMEREREREVFREDDRFDRRRRHDLFDEPTPSQIANQALAPYRRKSVVDRDFEVDVHREQTRRPARPQYIRRQSSLDTFDRRPLPRYGDRERDEWRPPANVPIPLPIRERRRSPPRYQEEEFDEERFVERDHPGRRDKVEEYREVEVHRAKSRRRRSPSRSVAPSQARSSSASSFEEIKLARADWGKKGRTRLPKRLCRVQAVTELGYPYEEEASGVYEDFIVITRALEKDHIDEIISVSEKYKETKMTYVYEDTRSVVEQPPVMMPPPPPPPMTDYAPPPPPPPPPASVHGNTVVYERSVRGASPPRSHHHEHYEERIEESNHIGGPLTVLVPEERRVVRRERDVRSEREIREEIRMLEDERRMLKYERDGDYEIIERREKPREVIRIEKDRKGRREPNPKLIAAMMATLT
ncbi:hypothetical protein PMIN01_07669 [Paraphaeosphaeria minitans]|uniref:DUF8035 domain-containing protein n=1 Tax=Paraphaeosphaeria minitans TaxID=565426 RepID=A0A9P6GFK4_9PLEO|nr:hypothetical protein PMIN01_07669 [Paraphaeosphaeria minitans]